MNKKYAKATLIAVVALISGINVFNAQKSKHCKEVVFHHLSEKTNNHQ